MSTTLKLELSGISLCFAMLAHFEITVCVGSYPDVVIEPQNQTVSVGEDVMLSCFNSNHKPVDWAGSSAVLKDSSGQRGRKIYSCVTGKLYVDLNDIRFDVSEANGFYNLTISNVTLADEGEYMCRDGREYGPWMSVFLRVIVPEILATTGSIQSPNTSDSNLGAADIGVNAGVAVAISMAVVGVVGIVVGVVLALVLVVCCRKTEDAAHQLMSQQMLTVDGSKLPSHNVLVQNKDPDRHSFPINKLPFELLQMILTKLAVMFSIQLKKDSTEADDEAVKFLIYKYPAWRDLFVIRQIYREQLQKTFDYLDRPFRRRLPNLAKLLRFEGAGLNIFTILDGYIYVVSKPYPDKPYMLFVYGCDNYKLLLRQELDKVIQPTGIVGHKVNKSIYIGDRGTTEPTGIWNVSPWIPGTESCTLTWFYQFQDPKFSAKSFDVNVNGLLVILVEAGDAGIKAKGCELHIVNNVGLLVDKDGELVSEPIAVDSRIENPFSVACIGLLTFAIAGLYDGSQRICLVNKNGALISHTSEEIGFAYSMCSLKYASNKDGILVADYSRRKILLLSVNGNKLAVRKLLKQKWVDCVDDPVDSGVTDKRDYSLGVERNHSGATNKQVGFSWFDVNFANAKVRKLVLQRIGLAADLVDVRDTKLPDDFEVTDEVNECNSLIAENDRDEMKMHGASNTVEPKCTDVQQEAGLVNPVRLAYDIGHLVVGLKNGKVLVYRLR